jgi:hypothetical protein
MGAQGRSSAFPAASEFFQESRTPRLIRETVTSRTSLRVRIPASGMVYGDILDLLRDHDMTLCISDNHDAPALWLATASHAYVRGHGPGAVSEDTIDRMYLEDMEATYHGLCAKSRCSRLL